MHKVLARRSKTQRKALAGWCGVNLKVVAFGVDPSRIYIGLGGLLADARYWIEEPAGERRLDAIEFADICYALGLDPGDVLLDAAPRKASHS